jgi:hypothetical protein|tara:strand:- start:1611 stop:1976 length:366 start_codon:yes stop_codon:yes gene_type:complete
MMIRIFYTGVLVLFLSACGGLQKYEAGIAQQAKLILRGEALVGCRVDVGPRFSLLVSKSDLTAYEFGVLGSKDSETESLQTIVLEVESGSQSVKVSYGTSMIYDKTLYFSDGQTRDIRISK